MNPKNYVQSTHTWVPYAIGSAIVSIMICIFSGFIIWQNFKTAEKDAEMFTENTVIMLAKQINGVFDKADLLLQAIDYRYRDELIRGTLDSEGFNTYLSESLNWSQDFDNIGFIDAKGIYRFGKDLLQPVILSDRDYFTLLRDRPPFSGSGPMIFSEPLFTRLSKKWTLVMSRRVEHQDGSFAGVVFIRWDLESVSKMFESVRMGSEAVLLLRNSDMAQISRYPMTKAKGMGPGNRGVSEKLKQLIQHSSEYGFYKVISPLDNIERYYSYLKVDKYPFYVIAGQPTNHQLSNWSLAEKLVLAFSILMIVMVIGGARRMFILSQKIISSAVENIAQQIITASPVAMFLLNKKNVVTKANPAAERLFDSKESLLIGLHREQLQPEGLTNPSGWITNEVFESDNLIKEALFTRHDGSRFTALQSIAKIPNINGNQSTYLETIVDISWLKKIQQQLKQLSQTDKLTGLLNRESADLLISQAMYEAATENSPFSMIMGDIDHFKKINDTFGHPVGDKVLIQIASVIKSGVRDGDYCIRWGGEEFLIVLPNCSIDVASNLAERIRIKIEEIQDNLIGQVTISFGVAKWEKSETIDSLIIRADQTLYKAKHNGRNCVVTDEGLSPQIST